MNSKEQSPLGAGAEARVLHVIASASHLRGGTSTAVWMTMDALKRQGVKADLVATDDDGPGKHLPVPLNEFIEQNGIRVRYFARQSGLYNFSAPMLWWLFKNIRRYDLVHVHGVFSFAPMLAAHIARLHRVPFVVCPHGMLERWGLQNGKAGFKRASIRYVEGPALRYAAAVHFTSESERAQATELGFPLNAAVFPLALGELPRASSVAAAADGTASASILFLSRVDVKKGLDILIDAVARLRPSRPNLRVIIAGTGPDALIAELKALAALREVSHNITWAGFVQGAEKAKLFSEATVFVLPSRSENFGYAVAEAMAAGLPVVITHAVGICDMVRRVGAGRVADVNARSIAAELGRVLNDPEGRRRMGEAGREAILRELTVDAFGGKLAQLYASIIGSRAIASASASASD